MGVRGPVRGAHVPTDPPTSGLTTRARAVWSPPSCVQKYMTFTGCSLCEAIDAASLHPAQALGIDNERGSLQPGMLADVILLDMDLNVQATYGTPSRCTLNVRPRMLALTPGSYGAW